MTSLFLDIVGSTDLMMRISPERLKRVLDEAFGDLTGVIAEHGGTVEKYVGDAIFAVFGVPIGHADDPLRALRAAEACAQWAEARSEDRVPIAVRIGVETGQALVDLDAVWMPIRTRMRPGISASRAAAAAASAPCAVGKATKNASPCVSTSTPPCPPKASRRMRRCPASVAAYPSGPSSCSRRVDPSTSVNRNVTVPEGRSRCMAGMMRQHRVNITGNGSPMRRLLLRSALLR